MKDLFVKPAVAAVAVASVALLPQSARAGWEFDPESAPYPTYLADPRSPRMRVAAGAVESEIPETTAGRIMLDTGTRYTLAKRVPDDPEDTPLWLDIEGGVFMQFDPLNSLDSVGWDGIFGAYAVGRLGPELNMRVGYQHRSGHLGDELIERTGRTRIGYTREMGVLGANFSLTPHVTAHIEPSYAFRLGDDPRLRPWALDVGMQYKGPAYREGGDASVFAGVHVESHQETDWRPAVSVSVGREFRGVGNSGLRLQLEAYRGRAQLGEFALDFDEAYLLASFTVDFYSVDFY